MPPTCLEAAFTCPINCWPRTTGEQRSRIIAQAVCKHARVIESDHSFRLVLRAQSDVQTRKVIEGRLSAARLFADWVPMRGPIGNEAERTGRASESRKREIGCLSSIFINLRIKQASSRSAKALKFHYETVHFPFPPFFKLASSFSNFSVSAFAGVNLDSKSSTILFFSSSTSFRSADFCPNNRILSSLKAAASWFAACLSPRILSKSAVCFSILFKSAPASPSLS